MATGGLNIRSRTSGILSLAGLTQYQTKIKKKVKIAYGLAVKQATKETKVEMKNKASTAFKVKKKTFLNTFSAKIYDSKPDKLASVLFLQKIKWFKLHETGGTINGKMVLPFENINGKRMTPKKWKALLKSLKQNKQSFWKNINGKLILFAVIDRSNSRSLSGYRQTFKARKSIKKVKAGTAIPIGMMVTTIRLKRRYNFTGIVDSFAPGKIVDHFNNNLNLT